MKGALGVILFLSLILGLIVYFIVGNVRREEADLLAFLKQHNCKVVEYKEGRITMGYGYGTTISGNFGYGIIAQPPPSQTAYLCDNGVVAVVNGNIDK